MELSTINFTSCTLIQLKQLISIGLCIVWTGYLDENTILIRLSKDKKFVYKKLDIRTLKVPQNPHVIVHNETTSKPLSFVGVTWQRRGWLRVIRIASIYGINIASDCTPGLDSEPLPIEFKCTMGYDIEISQSLVKHGEFPPSYSRITSIALWCTCGYCEAWTTIRHNSIENLNYCISSTELVEQSLKAISIHSPEWLVGYNCFQFDNCCMLYHCPLNMKQLFRPINSGTKAVSRDSFYIDIHGVNNVDLYSYLDKSLRRTYKALNLGAVAEHHGIGGKMQMPITDSEETVYQLIKYNINDSRLTAKLWYITGAVNQIVGLCVASCSPVIDCNRYVTGTMASCTMSSYCISNNMLMDWSECNLRIGYEGGTVLDPKRGLYKDVFICDFSSMYPTIIIDVNISPENILHIDTCSILHDDKIVTWDTSSITLCIKGKVIKFNTKVSSICKSVLKKQLVLRKKHKVSNASYSTAIKGTSNSLYGALGFAASPLHSPRCAATVTVVGRSILSLAKSVFSSLGLNVIYGDTDSLFIARGKKTKTHFKGDLQKHIDSVLKIFHNILKFTPVSSMRMEIEARHKAIVLVDKKNYAYADSAGNIKTKGLSHTRKDRIGLCRDMTAIIAEQLLLGNTLSEATSNIVKIVDACYGAIISYNLTMYSVSSEVRFEGNSCYRYTDASGIERNVLVAKADKYSVVKYDPNKIMVSLEKDLNRLVIPAGIGTVSNLLVDIEL